MTNGLEATARLVYQSALINLSHRLLGYVVQMPQGTLISSTLELHVPAASAKGAEEGEESESRRFEVLIFYRVCFAAEKALPSRLTRGGLAVRALGFPGRACWAVSRRALCERGRAPGSGLPEPGLASPAEIGGDRLPPGLGGSGCCR